MSSPDLEKQAKEAFFDDDFELAVDLYTQALDLAPTNADLFADRAQANIKLSNFTEAVADASKAIELDPSMTKAYLRKGTACLKLEEYQTAKAALEAGVPLAPGDSRFNRLIKQCEERVAGRKTMCRTKRVEEACLSICSCVSNCSYTAYSYSNCSCTAYSYSNNICSMWNTALVNIQQATNASSNVHILNLRLAASELPDPKTNHKTSDNGVAIRAIIGSIGGVAIVLAILLVLLWRRRRQPLSTKAKAAMEAGVLIPFRYRELQKMTKNFSEELGRGGFGYVFKLLPVDSTTIAVKKLEGGIVQKGEKQFRTEVSTIGTIQHVNLIRLRGFCSEVRHKIACFRVHGDGLARKQLFKKSNATVLSWSTRYRIALGVARGIVYLHERCRDVIIHCDIKPENILLDDNWVPKVADFGMRSLWVKIFSRVLTTMRGTIGYLAPEWIYGTMITTKADVYSYGMMLLEIISGRRNNEQRDKERGGPWFFAMTAASKILEGDVLGLLDRKLDGNVAKLEELERVCKVAFWCIQDSENYRPSMSEIVQILEGVKDVEADLLDETDHADEGVLLEMAEADECGGGGGDDERKGGTWNAK